MSRVNMHIFLSRLESETRLFKEAAYTLGNGIFDRVVVLGLWKEGLPRFERTESGLEMRRVKTMIGALQQYDILRRLGLVRKVISALSLLQYIAVIIFAAVRLRPHSLSCHNVYLLPAAWLAAQLSGAHLVYLPHELESERSGLSAAGRWVSRAFEKLLIHRARAVVVVNDPIRDWYKSAYRLQQVHVVRNMPERSAVAIHPLGNDGLRQRFSVPPDALVFIYQGGFGASRCISELLRTFSNMEPEKCHFVLMGFGGVAEEEEVRRYARDFTNIHFLPAVSRELIVSFTACADIGINVSNLTPLNQQYSLPNKFYEYSHAGLALLVSDNLTHQSSLIIEAGLGWSVPFESLAETIAALSWAEVTEKRKNSRAFSETAVWEVDAIAFQEVYA
ncbi:putative glycosyl transferase [Paracoccaceae bacterium]